MPAIPDSKVSLVKDLYYKEKKSMRDIAANLGVSLDAVIYFMRKYKLERRTLKQANACVFESKPASFKRKNVLTLKNKELRAIGVALYWAEGYKTEKATGIDFANSDPEMIRIFVAFLRNIYELDESRFRVLLYCYKNQDIKQLISFWSNLVDIPKSQFIKPYVRKDFRSDGRRMQNGLVHIRYSDKKLLLDFRKLLESYKRKFA